MDFLKRAGAGVVLVSGVLAGLVAPGVAQAALPAIKLEICNDHPKETRNIEIIGKNQNDQNIRWLGNASSLTCSPVTGWRWKTGQTVQITHSGTSGARKSRCPIQSGLTDGTTSRCRIR